MKIRVLAYCLIILTWITSGCGKSKDIEDQRYTWSTDTPLSIPLRVRVQRFERGNLIRNPSFESGKIFKLDSATTSFAIDGWQQQGRNVLWVDIQKDSIFRSDEVYSGKRSVKITRHTALETDVQGEGIQSDFIKVIPGNYKLSMYVRMENIRPQRPRLGTRMFDGVEISIQYYDRNKIRMNSGFNFPQKNQRINASLKALSLANFKEIPSFGWGRIIGKSHGFPFPEGDIPSEAHFIKIYIGLKGTGTLWVDSVDFHYTGQNFSISERMQIFTDTAFHTPEVIIPRPKNVTKMESVIFMKPNMSEDKLPIIVVPRNTDKLVKRALQIVHEAFTESMVRHYGKSEGPAIYNELTAKQLENSKLIISIGKTDVYNTFRGVLPEKDIQDRHQGYFIYSPSDYPNLVILGSNDDAGLCYAAFTALQMIDDKAPVFHNARIVDYPDFENRYFTLANLYNPVSLEQQEAVAKELIKYKYNGAFLLNPELLGSELNSSRLSQEDLFTVIPVTGYHPPGDSDLTYKYPISCKDYDIEAGSDVNYLIPPVFHNEMLDNSDFSGICCQLSANTKHFYSGSSFFSVNTDAADITRFTSVMGHDPVFMDNSMRMLTPWGQFGGNAQYYPGKLRLYNIFDPFMNSDIAEFFPMLDTSMFVINLPAASEIELIRLATAAEFLWNASAYSKDYALWRVLMSRYGAENARELIIYADKYSILLEVIRRIEMNMQATRNAKTGQQTMAEITNVLSGISGRLGVQNKLVKELQQLNSGLRNRLNKSVSAIPVKK